MLKSACFCLFLGAFSRVQSLVSSTAAQNCTGTFTPVSASAVFAALDPGWNLGNTLDATPDEGSWNNAPVQAVTFSQIQAKGFKSVRIPGKFFSARLKYLTLLTKMQSPGHTTSLTRRQHGPSTRLG
jgi:aryl-phospho-beta-D-glucosidase BglC (GH1 family)